jgi:hypothetical protein
MSRRLAIALSMVIVASPLVSRAEMVPLNRLDLTQKTEEFIILRCVGLYVAVLAAAEGGNLPEAFLAETRSKAGALMIELTTRHRARFGSTQDEAREAIVRDATQFSNAYSDVFDQSYVETGERFDNELFYSDAPLCAGITEVR